MANTMVASRTLDLGNYSWPLVSNVDRGNGLSFFNYGYQLLLAFQHELAAKYFADCVVEAPDCALAHSLIAYCHSPNYNFKGEAYYNLSFDYSHHSGSLGSKSDDTSSTKSSNGDEGQIEVNIDESQVIDPPFPSQIVADRHSNLATQIVERLNKNKSGASQNNGLESPSKAITDLEVQIIKAIRILTCNPGMDPSRAEENKDIPFSNALRDVYERYPRNPEVAFIFVASIMTIHAWKLFEYPTGRPLSSAIVEIQTVMEKSLKEFPEHVGLCHMYCHLSEMSSSPEKALPACDVLRTKFPDAGHLLHMPTHIDVLIGDYESCVRWNMAAIEADKKAMEYYPKFNHQASFYFGYIVHDYHMLVYGAILGAMEGVAMDVAKELNAYVHEDLFREQPHITEYLESYSAMDIHIMFRFGRWSEILRLKFPRDSNLMLYRTASLYYARAVAYANLGDIAAAKEEAKCFEKLRANHPSISKNILHNNTVSDLLEVDSAMMKGEIAYFEGKHELAFETLRHAVDLQDGLNYDEPWGKMQPIRHALGGLLLQQGFVQEAEEVFRSDLIQHPKNPWALVGLIDCLHLQIDESENDQRPRCSGHQCGDGDGSKVKPNHKTKSSKIAEIKELQDLLDEQRKCQWADFHVMHSCACVRG